MGAEGSAHGEDLIEFALGSDPDLVFDGFHHS